MYILLISLDYQRVDNVNQAKYYINFKCKYVFTISVRFTHTTISRLVELVAADCFIKLSFEFHSYRIKMTARRR